MIVLVAFYPMSETTKAYIQRHVEGAFAQPVSWRRWQGTPEAARLSGGQLFASPLFRMLQEELQAPEDRVLGIVDRPLVDGVKPSVLLLKGSLVLVSAGDLSGGPFRLAEQLAALSVHGLGHSFGLTHCEEPDCVMNPAETPEEAARIRPHLGWRCRMDLAA